MYVAHWLNNLIVSLVRIVTVEDRADMLEGKVTVAEKMEHYNTVNGTLFLYVKKVLKKSPYLSLYICNAKYQFNLGWKKECYSWFAGGDQVGNC